MAKVIDIREPVGFGNSSLAGHRPIRNRAGDVSVIQDMLGRIAAEDGGSPGLKVTEKILGPNDPTVVAIRKFQRKQFGFEDGVVDPGAKTEKKLQQLSGGDEPAPTPPVPESVTIDTVVRIMGQDPRSGLAGKPTAEGQGLIFVPEAADLETTIATPDYTAKNFRLDLINFFGGGGRANPASDPTKAIMDLIRAKRQAAQTPGSAKISFGRMIVYGWSIGGRNAATLARQLNTEGIAIDYLGIIDAAFDDENDGERTGTVKANKADNFFEGVSNDLRGEFPEFEFHGDIQGCQNQRLEDSDLFYRNRKKQFDDGKHSKKAAILCFDDLHKKAVTDGHRTAQGKVLGLLKPDR
jgi:hypothetical protein